MHLCMWPNTIMVDEEGTNNGESIDAFSCLEKQEEEMTTNWSKNVEGMPANEKRVKNDEKKNAKNIKDSKKSRCKWHRKGLN